MLDMFLYVLAQAILHTHRPTRSILFFNIVVMVTPHSTTERNSDLFIQPPLGAMWVASNVQTMFIRYASSELNLWTQLYTFPYKNTPRGAGSVPGWARGLGTATGDVVRKTATPFQFACRSTFCGSSFWPVSAALTGKLIPT